MAWGRSKGAIALYDGVNGRKGYANKTSMATLYVPNDSGGGKLRMWDIRPGTVEVAFALFDLSPGRFLQEPQTSLPSDPDRIPNWQCYLDSNADFSFSINTNQQADRILIQTGVPAERAQFKMRFDRITGYPGDFGEGGIADTPSTGIFKVWYKDPCVIAVPEAAGGGYLMVLVRYRMLWEDRKQTRAWDLPQRHRVLLEHRRHVPRHLRYHAQGPVPGRRAGSGSGGSGLQRRGRAHRGARLPGDRARRRHLWDRAGGCLRRGGGLDHRQRDPQRPEPPRAGVDGRNDPVTLPDRIGLLSGGDADPSLYELWRLRAGFAGRVLSAGAAPADGARPERRSPPFG